MTIKADGYNFRNSESGKLIGTVHESKDKDYSYYWETYGDIGKCDINHAVNTLKDIFSTRAENLGCDIEFTDI